MTELGSIKERELSEGVECMKFVKWILEEYSSNDRVC